MQNGDSLRLFHQIQADLLDAPAFHAESLCGAIGDVDDSAVYHRAAVIHAHYNGWLYPYPGNSFRTRTLSLPGKAWTSAKSSTWWLVSAEVVH